MNGAAHYLFSVIITLLIYSLFSDNIDLDENKSEFNENNISTNWYLIISLICVFNFFAHAFVDALARFTYHPSVSDWSNPVYLYWHLSTYVAEALFAIWILKTDIRYFWGMIASVGFDLWDWSISRPLKKFYNIELPGVHWMADLTEHSIFGWAPSLRNVQPALIIEIISVIVLTLIWIRLRKKVNFHRTKYSNRWAWILVIILLFGSLRLFTLI